MRNVRVIIFFSLLLIVAFLLLVGRCFYLQYSKSEHYINVCAEQQQGWVTGKPQRGVILDCRGRVLAASNKIQVIFAEPRIIEDPKTVSNELAPIVDIAAHEICKLITESKNPGFAKIKVGAGAAQCTAARKIYGIGVQSDWQRHYPTGRLAAHAVGFTSVDNRGLGGIELQYEKELGGLAGQSIFFADVRRRPVRRASLVDDGPNHEPRAANQKPIDGVGIILTLDATVQQFARAELIKQYESYEAESAVAIVADPGSGAILALVSLPDFDPNNARSADPNNFRNRAITDQFEPGSILKPIAAALALDAGVVNRSEKIFCENGNYHGKGFGQIGEYQRGFGDLTVREILIQSSNIGMAKIGQRLGKDKFHKGLALFGFGKETGVELPGEAEGYLQPAEQWTGYSVTRIPFGQEISVTAIQLVQAFCTVANGGRPVRPFLVRAVVDNTGKFEIRDSRLEIARQVGYVIRPEIARWIVTDALVGVVNEGTGRKAQLEKWQVFGKTGTAQIAKTDGRGYTEDAYVASFVAGAPADKPAVVVLVSVHRPNVGLGKGYNGGTVAAPVAAKILEKTLNYLERNGLMNAL